MQCLSRSQMLDPADQPAPSDVGLTPKLEEERLLSGISGFLPTHAAEISGSAGSQS